MLQHFQYLSSDGRDQGANVRNRAKELTNMLSDVNKIRSERKLAKTRRERTGNHSRGFGSMGGISYDASGFSGSHGYDTDIRRNSIHGGFGGYSGGVYGDGGGFEDSSSRGNHEHSRGGFQEYEVEIPEVDNANSYVPSLDRSNATMVTRTSSYKTTPPPVQKQVDLFSFDDVQPVAPQNPATNSSNNHESTTTALNQDDEFDDFQSAELAVPNTQPPAASQKTADSILDLFNTPAPTTFNTMPSYNSPITPIADNRPLSMMNFNTPPAASTTRPAGANYGHNRSFSTVPTTGNYGFNGGATISNGSTSSSSSSSAAKKDDAFSSIWTSSKVKSSESRSTSKPAAPQESLI
ncbi:hypothetical protein D0Z00_001030 [Geotrichum galactomycetum]|uniref:Uncharacterized protein n=1 Tax=Geotrichum galactomycetum TaxID=27317 RepID=A0ACB6V876_9ASCO|nr:hypothetical protein D0Z00_001030 [Geotrichum candidum]